MIDTYLLPLIIQLCCSSCEFHNLRFSFQAIYLHNYAEGDTLSRPGTMCCHNGLHGTKLAFTKQLIEQVVHESSQITRLRILLKPEFSNVAFAGVVLKFVQLVPQGIINFLKIFVLLFKLR